MPFPNLSKHTSCQQTADVLLKPCDEGADVDGEDNNEDADVDGEDNGERYVVFFCH